VPTANDNLRSDGKPIWAKKGNVLKEFTEELFDDGYGHTGIMTIANYTTKKGDLKSILAYIKWYEQNYVKSIN